MNLSTSVEKIPRIGPQYKKKLKKLGIKTIRDLIFHFPHRYEDFSDVVLISKAKTGQNVCIQGEILEIKNSRTWKRRMALTNALIKDESGAIKVVWFNQPYIANALKKGNLVCLAGKIASGPDGPYLSSPAYENMGPLRKNRGRVSVSAYRGRVSVSSADLIHTGRLVPVYPETEGLSSRWLRFILKPVLTAMADKIQEPLPEQIIKEQALLPLKKAVWQIHFPDSLDLAKKAQYRFAFQDLFLINLFVLKARQKIARQKAFSIRLDLELIRAFLKTLPFRLTPAQKKSAWQILKDLEKPRPMNRLLEGDVGSGKTVVAVMAGLNAVKAGFQTAFMAPTEILAKQHFQEVSKLLRRFDVSIGLLTGKESRLNSEKISRKKLLEKIKTKEVQILIGTHALIQKWVKFRNLALVILDEQHRFGIEQRAALVLSKPAQKKIGAKTDIPIPHLLSMTATPIPRTLALTLYGDLDLSLIDELPKGRKKIITKIVPPKKRKLAYEFIRKQIKKGRQAFVICPRIESPAADVAAGLLAHVPFCPLSRLSPRPAADFQENELGQTNKKKTGPGLNWTEVKAVKEEYERLSKKIFPELEISMLHGKMKTKEKEKIMTDFKDKKTNILVSTSVIEVGIDIPNASVMMIEGAEMFGLSQLHQFRGRVGRAEHQSYCFLFTGSGAKKTWLRLMALLTCEDGFKLAEKDLKIRGPGGFWGKRQWGIPDLAMKSLKNTALVKKTRQTAKQILSHDPKLKNWPELRAELKDFEQRVHLE